MALEMMSERVGDSLSGRPFCFQEKTDASVKSSEVSVKLSFVVVNASFFER